VASVLAARQHIRVGVGQRLEYVAVYMLMVVAGVCFGAIPMTLLVVAFFVQLGFTSHSATREHASTIDWMYD
jgi:hypothetical protein